MLVLYLVTSHVFTGAEILGIVSAWVFVEKFVLKRSDIPAYVLPALGGMAVLFAGYYLVFLPSIPEARSTADQWRLNWVYGWKSEIPAYLLVLSAVAYRVRSWGRLREFLADPTNRVLAIWAIGAFVLSNHDLLVHEPVQPVHFTRGYVWTPLFLMGMPTLLVVFEWLRERLGRFPAAAAVALVAALFLSDNILWYGGQVMRNERFGIQLTRDDRDLLGWLDGPENASRIVVTPRVSQISYAATVWTGLRAWHSHKYNTPYVGRRRAEVDTFYASGAAPVEWSDLPLLVVMWNQDSREQSRAWLRERGGSPVFRNETYTVFRVK